jgi:hypothetical protein
MRDKSADGDEKEKLLTEEMSKRIEEEEAE